MDDETDVARPSQPSPLPRTRIVREIWWVVLSLAFAAYVLTARISTYRGIKGRSSASIRDIWRDLADDLPDVSSPALLTTGYIALILVFVTGSLTALWLALAADGSDESELRTPDAYLDPLLAASGR